MPLDFVEMAGRKGELLQPTLPDKFPDLTILQDFCYTVSDDALHYCGFWFFYAAQIPCDQK